MRLIWRLLSERDVEARFYLGTESSSFLADIDAQSNKFDYQYSSFYNLSIFDDLDLLIVSIGTLSIYQSNITVDEFLSRMPDIPIVLLDNNTELKNGAWLIADNYNGIADCVEHLINEHGLKKLLFLGGPLGNRNGEERLRGYLDTMEKYGLEVTEDMIEHGDYSEHVDETVERLLDNNPDAEGIVSANDELTVAIYRVCGKRGLEPGRALAVTGFDDTELAKYMTPPLTTVKQDYDLLSKKAVEKAFDILEKRNPVSERVASPMICRASCGCRKIAGSKSDRNDETERDEYMGIFAADDEKDTERVRELIRDKCREYTRISGKPYYLEISLGFHIFRTEEYTELTSVMEKADAELYEAKKQRRASVVRHCTEITS